MFLQVSEKLNGNPTVCMVVCSDYLVEMKLLQKNLQQAGSLITYL